LSSVIVSHLSPLPIDRQPVPQEIKVQILTLSGSLSASSFAPGAAQPHNLTMASRAALAFQSAIKDAEELLGHFDHANAKPPPPPNAEVLKRAGLIMALTAWETFVEDRAKEALDQRLAAIKGSPVATFVERKFDEEVKRLHNPTAEKTRRLYFDYVGVDVTVGWNWSGVTTEKAQQTLDGLLAKRGAAAHRSDAVGSVNQSHLVKREDLERTIKFLRQLVERTDAAL
jgi:hypothetical protein